MSGSRLHRYIPTKVSMLAALFIKNKLLDAADSYYLRFVQLSTSCAATAPMQADTLGNRLGFAVVLGTLHMAVRGGVRRRGLPGRTVGGGVAGRGDGGSRRGRLVRTDWRAGRYPFDPTDGPAVQGPDGCEVVLRVVGHGRRETRRCGRSLVPGKPRASGFVVPRDFDPPSLPRQPFPVS